MKNALILFVVFISGCVSTHYFWFTGTFTFAKENIKWERNRPKPN